jgi:hypothetical protein
LLDTLVTMSAVMVEGASRTFALMGRKLDAAGIAADPALAAELRAALAALAAAAG